jgi:hypothetical protein
MNTRLILIGFVGAMALAVPRFASGQYWGNGWPYGAGYCCYPYLSSYSGESVPYFAVHPPVYYSYRVPRTYGYSPFAYPPGVLTPGSEPPRPAWGQNPYASGDAAGTLEGQQGNQPQRIDNPFVEQTDRPGVTKNLWPAGRRIQVVYPAALAQQPAKVAEF